MVRNIVKIKYLNKCSHYELKQITVGSAGYDIYSAERVLLLPNSTTKINTGIAIEIPSPNLYARIAEKSSLSLKGILILGGVVDSDYRGPIYAVLHNLSSDELLIEPGNPVGQLIFECITCPNIIESQELTPTERGGRGFGRCTEQTTNNDSS